MADWGTYQGYAEPHTQRFYDESTVCRPSSTPPCRHPAASGLPVTIEPTLKAAEAVNVAPYLRRPILVTGKPGTGKSSLPYGVAREAGHRLVLRWTITNRPTLSEGLYPYDAIGRLQDVNLSRRDVKTETEGGHDPMTAVQAYSRLGPLGTALVSFERRRVLLIDGIDKSEMDLPDHRSGLLEYPEYGLDELAGIARLQPEMSVLAVGADAQADRASWPGAVHGIRVRRHDRQRRTRVPSGVPAALSSSEAANAESRQGPLDKLTARRANGDLAADRVLNAIYLYQLRRKRGRDQPIAAAELPVICNHMRVGIMSPDTDLMRASHSPKTHHNMSNGQYMEVAMASGMRHQ